MNTTTKSIIFLFLVISVSFKLKKMDAHLVRIIGDEQQVKGYCRHDIDDEPSSEIVQGDLGRVGDNLVIVVHISSPEVYHYVHHEHYVH